MKIKIFNKIKENLIFKPFFFNFIFTLYFIFQKRSNFFFVF